MLETSSTIRQAVKDLLSHDEEIVWTGRPLGGLRLRSSDIVGIPFSIMWCAFMVFWETAVVTRGAPLFFRLWGIPFVCVGLYMLIGRFFYDAWKRAGTYYALTTQRVLIVERGNVKSLPLLTLSDVTLDENRDGVGTIFLGPRPPGPLMMRQPRVPEPPALAFVPGVRSVYQHLMQAIGDCVR